MRDKILIRAILISIAVHLVAVTFVGRTSSTRLNAASVTAAPQRLLDVHFVKDPLSEPKPEPKPTVVPRQEPEPDQPRQNPLVGAVARIFGRPSSAPARPSPARVASRAGGALNTGTASSHGDLEGMSSGRTPAGWVSGSDSGRGMGSGSAAGTGAPEPPRVEPRHVDPTPAAAPVPPPAPIRKRVTVRICEASGMLAGEHCKNTRNASYDEGDEPRHTCDRCREPEPVHVSRLADRDNPVLTHDVAPDVPDSIDEGQTLQAEVEYWVDTDGSVSDVRIARSSGNRELDRRIIRAASQWRYNPAVQDGVARRVKVTRPVRVKT